MSTKNDALLKALADAGLEIPEGFDIGKVAAAARIARDAEDAAITARVAENLEASRHFASTVRSEILASYAGIEDGLLPRTKAVFTAFVSDEGTLDVVAHVKSRGTKAPFYLDTDGNRTAVEQELKRPWEKQTEEN